jgi:hypothetical protein
MGRPGTLRTIGNLHWHAAVGSGRPERPSESQAPLPQTARRRGGAAGPGLLEVIP